MDSATALGHVRALLQDTGKDHVWRDPLLTFFLEEAVNRLAPECALRSREAVTPAGETELSLTTLFGAPVIAVEQVKTADTDSFSYDIFGDAIIFTGDLPAEPYTIYALREFVDITEVPRTLVDACVYYAAGRAFRWLVNRGGAGLRRYLDEQGELEAAELSDVAASYETDYFARRSELATAQTMVGTWG